MTKKSKENIKVPVQHHKILLILIIVLLVIVAYLLGKMGNGFGMGEVKDEQAEKNVPEYFKTDQSDWKKATLKVNLIDIGGQERDSLYTLLVPPGISIETETETNTNYLKYKATDGYEYTIYPSDITVTNIVGPVYDEVDMWDSDEEVMGNHTWESQKILFKDGEMVWYLNSLIGGERHSFEISLPKKERSSYMNLVKKIISSFSLPLN